MCSGHDAANKVTTTTKSHAFDIRNDYLHNSQAQFTISAVCDCAPLASFIELNSLFYIINF